MAKKVVLTSENLKDGEYYDGIFSYKVDWGKRTAQVFCGIGEKIVIVPSEVTIDGKTFRVTSFGGAFGGYEFNDCSSIEEVVLPHTIISICDKAFYLCKSLRSIIIPEGVSSIGDFAFKECDSLESVIIPQSVKVIGNRAFYGCVRLADIQLLGNEIEIGNQVFDGTRWLWENRNKLDIENGILYIAKTAIQATDLCGRHVRLKEGTRHISNYAFRGNDLTFIHIPDSVKSIGLNAFDSQKLEVAYNQKIFAYLNPKTKGKYIIPEGIEVISGGAFSYCKNLTSITIPCSVKRIDERSFYKCSIKSITLPNGVKSIGESAFGACSQLKSIIIPNTVKTIEESAFKNCRALTSINIPNSVTSIGAGAFCRCGNIESVILPKGITKIEDTLFTECEKLTSIIIPEGVKEIGSRVFQGCKNLSFIVIPKSIERIGRCAFAGCDSLKTLVINNPNIEIDLPEFEEEYESGDFFTLELFDIFHYSEGLWYKINKKERTAIVIKTTIIQMETEYSCLEPSTISEAMDVVIPDTIDVSDIRYTVIGIADRVFRNRKINSVKLPESIKFIGESVFGGFGIDLDYLYIPENIEHIGAGAIGRFKHIEYPVSLERKIKVCGLRGYFNSFENIIDKTQHTFVIPSGIESIDYAAFDTTDWLSEIIIPDSVKHIEEAAFLGNCWLKSLTLPDGLLDIDRYAFSRSKISSINIPNTVKVIGDYAFEGCKNLTSITIPNGVTTIGEGAFVGCDNLISIIIPSSVRKIGKKAFPSTLQHLRVSEDNPVYDSRNDCNALIETSTNALIVGGENTVIPDSVISIEESAFYNTILPQTIPNSVLTIKYHAFENCAIQSLFIPYSVTKIEVGALWNCQLEKIEVDTNNSVYDSRNHCNAIIETATNTLHTGCSNTIMPNDIKSIGVYAFAKCRFNTKKLVLPDHLSVIDNFAFLDSSGFTDIVIPSGVEYIGIGAFKGIFLEAIYSKIINPELCFASAKAYDDEESIWNRKNENNVPHDFETTLFIPKGCLNLYLNTEETRHKRQIEIYYDSFWHVFDNIEEFDFEKGEVISKPPKLVEFKVIKCKSDEFE